MGKIITKPINYTYDQHTVGDITDIGNNQLEVNNIRLSKARNAVGEPKYSIASVCASEHINVWAAFRPTTKYDTYGWDYDHYDDELIPVLPQPSEPHRLGDFAGYNPYAKPTKLDINEIENDVRDRFFHVVIEWGELTPSDILFYNDNPVDIITVYGPNELPWSGLKIGELPITSDLFDETLSYIPCTIPSGIDISKGATGDFEVYYGLDNENDSDRKLFQWRYLPHEIDNKVKVTWTLPATNAEFIKYNWDNATYDGTISTASISSDNNDRELVCELSIYEDGVIYEGDITLYYHIGSEPDFSLATKIENHTIVENGAYFEFEISNTTYEENENNVVWIYFRKGTH